MSVTHLWCRRTATAYTRHYTTLPPIDDTTQFGFLGFCVVFSVCVSGGSSAAPYASTTRRTPSPSTHHNATLQYNNGNHHIVTLVKVLESKQAHHAIHVSVVSQYTVGLLFKLQCLTEGTVYGNWKLHEISTAMQWATLLEALDSSTLQL